MSAVRDAYDALAPSYDGVFVQAGRRPWQAAYRPFLGTGVRLLDAGCGTGADLRVALGAGCVAAGFDGSSEMLRIAQASLDQDGTSAPLLCGDLRHVDQYFGAATFDVILSGFAALNTIANVEEFSAGCARILKPGGVLVLHFLTPGGLYDRVGHLARGRIGEAALEWRFRRRTVRVGEQEVEHQFYLPGHLFRMSFARQFTCLTIGQTGLLTPDDGPTRLPQWVLPPLATLEGAIRTVPLLRSLGRFGILTLRRR